MLRLLEYLGNLPVLEEAHILIGRLYALDFAAFAP